MIPLPHLSFVANLARVVDRFPDRLAVAEHGGETLTYAQLWLRASDTANRLREAGVSPGDVVALLCPRSAGFITSFIGSWLAEAVVLPLDPSNPIARLEAILKEAKPTVLVQTEKEITFTRTPFFHPSGKEADQSAPIPVPSVDTQRPAYLIYTSGSSGRPKAVLVSHRGLCPLISAQVEMFPMNECSRLFWMHGLGFDASISDIGTALLSGGTLCFASETRVTRDPELLLNSLRELKITHVDIPPSLLAYLDVRSVPESLVTIIIGGEVCPPAIVRKWASKCRLVNVYGPTEATICSSMIVCDEQWTRPLIGTPVPGVKYHVHDDAGDIVPHGTVGELWIEGPAVALGYPYLPDLTRKRFNLLGTDRIYRTGDRVVQGTDGIEFVGRVDRQIKLHGGLICPEEVERVLADHDCVSRAFVFVDVSRGTPSVLAACLEEAGSLSLESLRAHARRHLPSWMVPSKWLTLSPMPCLPNGKPDGRVIENLFRTSAPDADGDSPLTPNELFVANLFRRCLNRNQVVRRDDFFELGGDSLAVVAFVSIASNEGRLISADIVYRGRSVVGIAGLMDEVTSAEAMGRPDLTHEVESAWNALGRHYAQAIAEAGSRTILVTGASGFLGGAVLGELLGGTDCTVVCLVRGPETVERDRVMDSLHRNGNGDMLAEACSRCRMIVGDVSQPHLGMGSSRWAELAEEVDVVFHLAADICLFKPYYNLKATNVDGVRHILEFCRVGPRKRLHLASTLSVFVDADPGVAVCLEDDLRQDVTQVHGGYAQSKWVAEQLVIKARINTDLAASIYRFGLLTANTVTGHAPRNDWLTMFLGNVGSENASADEQNRSRLVFDVTPVNHAARVMVWLALHAPDNIYHIAGERPVSLSDLAPAWAKFRQSNTGSSRTGDASHLASLRANAPDRFHRSLDLFKATDVRFSTRNTQNGLRGSGIEFPEISPGYLETCVRNALQRNST
jgi:amino acid adenylation domain-containing protein/thioester reductase-like protein